MKSLFKVLLISCIAFVCLISCSKETESKKADPNASIIGTILSSDSTEIVFESKGLSDTALVFVHGWSCDQGYWDNQFDYFSKNYKVVKLDLGGHGKSGTTRENYTMELFGSDVSAVVNHLDIKKVILIGHSMGDAVICEAAALLGDKAIALVGVDNFHNLNNKITEEQISGFIASFEEDFRTTTDEFVRGMFLESADSNIVNNIAGKMSSASPIVGLSAFRNYFRYDYIAAFEKLNLPLRSINADKYPTNTEENLKIVPDYKVEIIPNTQHFLHITQPVKFNDRLTKVLSELKEKN